MTNRGFRCCFLVWGAWALLAVTAKGQSETHQTDAGLAKTLAGDLTLPYAAAFDKPCPDQWKAFENAVRLERQVAADNGASYYVPAESSDEIIRIALGNPYVEPLRIDHAVPVVDDELSISLTHLSKPAWAARQVWAIGYRDPSNIPGKQFSWNTAVLGGDYGLFRVEVRYRNIEAPDAHVYTTIGGSGMCSGNMWCAPEIRSWDPTNRVLRSALIWRSVLKVPRCQQLALTPTTQIQEWYFEPPSERRPQGVKTYTQQR